MASWTTNNTKYLNIKLHVLDKNNNQKHRSILRYDLFPVTTFLKIGVCGFH